MKKFIFNKIFGIVFILLYFFLNENAIAQNSNCPLVNPGPSLASVNGRQLFVQKRNPDKSLMPQSPYSIRGVCWSPASMSTNTNKEDKNNANIRRQEFIKWYKTDIPLLKRMNVNTIRTFMDFGLGDTTKTILDELYCNDIMVIMTVDDAINDTARIRKVVEANKNHPAILMWMIGNEWNIYPHYYDTSISLSEAVQRTQDAATLIKSLDPNHPVATSYGDIDIDDDGRRLDDTRNYVNNICTSVDIWGLNIYRGSDFGPLFSQWKSISSKPMFLSEFGTDAFRSDPLPGKVDAVMQAQWDMSLWNDIFRNLSAYDKSKTVLGGTVFEWNDEWWKVSPYSSQDTGGYDNGGHPDGFANEEYFGVVDIDRKKRAVYDSLRAGFHPSYNVPARNIIFKAESAGSNVQGTSNGFAKFYKGNSLFYNGSGSVDSEGNRGFNIAAIDTATGELIVPVRSFDTWITLNTGIEMRKMIQFLNSLQNGTLIMIAVRDEAGLTNFSSVQCNSLSYPWVDSCYITLEALGSNRIRSYCFRNSWAMVTIKGEGSARFEQLVDSVVAVAQTTLINLAPTSYPPFLPSAPTLVSPQCGSSVLTTNTTLHWNKVDSSVSYRIQADDDSLFTTPLLINQVITDTVISLPGLVSGKTYFWRVNAKNATDSSRWSCTGKFTTDRRPRAEVIPTPVILPADSLKVKYEFFNALNTGNTFILQMTDTSGKENTYAEIARFNDTTRTGVLKTILSNSLLCGNKYRARVLSTNPPDTSINSNFFEIINKPPANIQTPSSDTVCIGQTILLKADSVPGAGYQWLKGGAIIPNETHQTYNASSAGAFRVRVSKNGCDSLSKPVNLVFVQGITAPSITAATTSLCSAGQGILLKVNPVQGHTYQWKKNGLNIPGATQPNYIASASGVYTVVITNTSGCSATSSGVTITVSAPPLATVAAAGPTTFCAGKNVLLKAITGTGYTYQWRKAGVNIPGQTLSTYTATATGAYTVEVTNATGCSTTSDPTNVTVTTVPLATVVVGGPLTFCSGKSVLLKTITGTGYTYQWKKGVVNLDGETSSNYTATASGNYSVLITNASGCTASSATFNVVVNPLPLATITPNGPLTFCSGKNVILRANTGSGYTYQWKRGGAIIQGATSFTYSATTAGYHIVIVTNAAGCSATSAASSVVVNPLPVATITPTGPTTFCNGKNVLLKANTGTNYTYQWKKAGVNITENGTQVNYTASVSGIYSVIVTNAFGCSATSAAINVTVNSAPPVTIVAAGQLTFCAGKKVLLKATVGNGYTYQWKRGGANLPGQTSSTYTADITGIYTAVVTNAAGCATTSNTINVNVNAAPLATITHDDPLTFPQGGSVVLKASKGTGYTYQWKKDGANLIGATFDNYKATISGSYTVVIISSNLCQTTSQPVQVSVTPGRPITKVISDDEDFITVYPNPLNRNDYLNIEWGITAADKGVLVTISDITGRKINSQLLKPYDKTVRVPGASGVYIFEFRWGLNKRKIFRVIKIE